MCWQLKHGGEYILLVLTTIRVRDPHGIYTILNSDLPIDGKKARAFKRIIQ
jgi:hypothetical protein